VMFVMVTRCVSFAVRTESLTTSNGLHSDEQTCGNQVSVVQGSRDQHTADHGRGLSPDRRPTPSVT
jgi:hypothetical protein